MTPAEIIYQRRIAVLDHAERTGNVSEACRVFSVSRLGEPGPTEQPHE